MRVLIALLLTQTVALGGFQTSRYCSAKLSPHRVHEAAAITRRIMDNQSRYIAVERSTSVPWYVIAGLHNMESGGSFRHHLHEGSPLSGRTRWIPKGRPASGSPPFSWEVSAYDALVTLKRMDRVNWKSLEEMLYQCERYNGLGYLKYHRSTPTPYLYAGTSIERPGKYVADGKWSSTARSKQLGIAAIWKYMEVKKLIKLPKCD